MRGTLIFLLVLAAELPWSVALAQAPATPPAPAPSTAAPATPAAPQAISAPDVVRRSEEVTARLRGLEESPAQRAEIEAIERRLPAVAEDVRSRVEPTIKALADSPPTAMLDNFVSPLLAARALLTGWAATLSRHATQVESDLTDLGTQRAAWQATRTEARRTGAPSAVLGRVDGTLSAISEAEADLKSRRTHLLSLQDHVSHETETIEDLLARIAAAREASDRQLLSRDSPPIWQAARSLDSLREVPARARQWVEADAAILRRFARTHGAQLVIHLMIWIVLSVTFYMLRRKVPAEVATDPSLVEARRLFRYPLAMALLVALFFSPWLYGVLPRPVRNLVYLIGVFPVLRVYTVLAPHALGSSFVALTAFFVIERLDDVAEVVPLFNQLVFLAEMLLAIAFVVALLFSYRRHPDERPVHLARALGLLMLAAMAGGLLLGAIGYTRLGRLLGSGALTVGYYAMLLQALLRVTMALLAYALRVGPLTYLRLVQRNRLLIERRLGRILWWLSVVGWVLAVLLNLGLIWPAQAMVMAVFGLTITRGNLSLSVGDITAFVLTVWLSFLVSRLIRFLLEEDVYPRVRLARGVPNLVSTLLHYSILLVGFILAIAAMGMDLNRVTILVSALGVGIGFGLQAVVNNFVSGLILLVERSIQVGDVIQVGDLSGEVRSIGIRSSMVRTGEGGDVIVPNGILATERVINWTLSDRMRRVDLTLRVPFSADPERVLQILTDVCANHPGVLRDPAPIVYFNGAADNGLLFNVWAWTPRIEDSITLRNSLGLAVLDAFKQAGIEVPVPRFEIKIPEGASALEARATRSPSPDPPPSDPASPRS
jgi:potassium efflux system protein